MIKTTSSYTYNPYIMGPPVTGTAFYGRQEVFRFVQETLATPQQNVIVLYGQRRIGKTSILLQLSDHLPQDEFHSIYFDLQGSATLKLSEVLYRLAVEIAKDLSIPSPRWSDFSDTDYFQSHFLLEIYEKLGQKRLLLLFDEFDALSEEKVLPSDAAAVTLFPHLQELVTNEPSLAFVFAIGRRIDELPTRFHAIFKRARSRRISVLRREEATELIKSPAKGQLEYTPEAIDAILDLTSGHPYFTQVVCHELFNYLHPPDRRLVTPQDVTDVLDGVMERGTGGFTWFWEGLPHTEQFILSAIAEITEESGFATRAHISKILQQYRIWLLGIELSSAPQRLVEWEMLKEHEADAYRFAIELVHRWVLQTHPLEKVKQEIESADITAARAYENAREAHVAGDLETAISDYHLALKANPKHAGAQLGLAWALHDQGELAQAIEEYERAFELDPVNAQELVEARIAFAQWLEEQDQLEKTAEQYRRVLQLLPNEKRVQEKLKRWYGQGLEYARLEEWQGAATLFERVQAISPGYEEVRTHLKNAKDRLAAQKRSRMGLAIGAVAVFLLGLGLVLTIPSVRSLLFAPTLTPTQVVLLPSSTPTPSLTSTSTSRPTPTGVLVTTPKATPTPTTISPTDTPSPTSTPISTDTPMPTTTPIVIVVTATPVPTPTPTPTPTLLPNPLGDKEVWDVDVNPNNGREVYVVAKSRGIYKTTNGGITWDLVEDEYKNIESLAIDLQNPERLYAGLWEAILKSTDGGTTWKAVTTQGGLPLQKTVHMLAVAPGDPQIIYAGTGNGAYRSSDGGETWTPRHGGMQIPIYQIILVSNDGNLAYAAGQAAEIFKRIDGGNSPWTKISCAHGEEALYSLAIHPENDQILYIGSDKSRVSMTTNGGYSWILSQEGFQYPDLKISALAIDPHNPDIIYAGTGDKSNLADDGIYKSSDSGRTWKPINTGLPMDSGGRHYSILAIAMDPNDSQIVYAGGLGGLYKSTDGGESWEQQ